MDDAIVVFTTCGSAEEAERVARALVDRRVAACANILPGVRSIYRWKGSIEDASEWMVLIKTRRKLFDDLVRELRAVHSYEVPEVIAVPVVAGASDYPSWVAAETSPERL